MSDLKLKRRIKQLLLERPTYKTIMRRAWSTLYLSARFVDIQEPNIRHMWP